MDDNLEAAISMLMRLTLNREEECERLRAELRLALDDGQDEEVERIGLELTRTRGEAMGLGQALQVCRNERSAPVAAAAAAAAAVGA